MDHRWSKRVPIRFSVVMGYGPLGLVMGKTRDISAVGMFVETHNVSLFNDETIELSFSYDYPLNRTVVRTLANVVHASESGVGLMLKDFRFDIHDESAIDLPLLVNGH